MANTVEWPLGNSTYCSSTYRRVVLGHPLLVEEVVVDAVREPLHVEESPAHVR
jgi:hypothetical protein